MSDSPHSRVSAAEREHALQELSQHFSSGRLSMVEFDDRCAGVLRAETIDQVAELFVDLPVAPFAPTGASAPSRFSLRVVAIVVVIGTVAVWWSLGSGAWLLLVTSPVIMLLLTRSRR